VPEFDKIFISLFDVSVEQIEQLRDGMLQAALMVQRQRLAEAEVNRILKEHGML